MDGLALGKDREDYWLLVLLRLLPMRNDGRATAKAMAVYVHSRQGSKRKVSGVILANASGVLSTV